MIIIILFIYLLFLFPNKTLKTHFISYYVILRFIYKHYLYIIYNYTNKNFTLSTTIKKLKIQNI